MSKGSMLMGTVRGKLGDAVFYRRQGEQQQRAYIRRVNDAQTRAQYEQRSQLANLVAFYRNVATLLDHSFTNRPGNQSSYNAFVSHNLNKVKVYLDKPAAGAGACVVAPYIVSAGSLPPIVVTGTGVTSVTNISVGTLDNLQDVSVADFTKALLANNASIREGDQLTYLSLVQSTNVQTSYPIVEAGYYEVTLSTLDDTLLSDIMPAQAIAVQDGYLAHGEKVADGGFCWILSRKDASGKLLCSRQAIIVTSTDLYKSYSGAAAVSRAVLSYNATGDSLLVPGGSTDSGVNAVPSISSVQIGNTPLSNNMYKFSSSSWGESPSLTINGSNLANIESVVVTITGGDNSEFNSAITASNLVKAKTKITGSLALPANLRSVTIKSVAVAMDGTNLYSMVTSDQRQDYE